MSCFAVVECVATWETPTHPGLLHQVSGYHLLQTRNLEGMSKNFQRENSAYNFRMQSERKQTLVLNAHMCAYLL